MSSYKFLKKRRSFLRLKYCINIESYREKKPNIVLILYRIKKTYRSRVPRISFRTFWSPLVVSTIPGEGDLLPLQPWVAPCTSRLESLRVVIIYLGTILTLLVRCQPCHFTNPLDSSSVLLQSPPLCPSLEPSWSVACSLQAFSSEMQHEIKEQDI